MKKEWNRQLDRNRNMSAKEYSTQAQKWKSVLYTSTASEMSRLPPITAPRKAMP